jgi:hypothetical protein
LLPDKRYQLTGIFLGDSKLGMNQGTVPGIGDEPVTCHILFHVNGFNRAYSRTETAPLTSDRVNSKVLYRLKTAEFLAQAALDAPTFINGSNLPTPELMTFSGNRL